MDRVREEEKIRFIKKNVIIRRYNLLNDVFITFQPYLEEPYLEEPKKKLIKESLIFKFVERLFFIKIYN